jgi:amino acid transporter
VSVLTITLYVFVAVAAIVHRVRERGVDRPFRMPLWPLPPVIAIVGAGLALSQQSTRDLLIVAILFVLGLVYYALYLRPRGRGVASLGSSAPADAPTQD